MHNPLPSNFDLHEEFTHPKFDEILEYFKPCFANPEKITAKVIIDGAVNGSDIKWNNLSGKWRLAVIRDNQEIASLIGCQVDCFTGNCGVKAIDHLYLFFSGLVKLDDKHKSVCRDMVKILESFLYHRTNCGLLIGSDTNAKEAKGQTITLIEQYGDDYKIEEPTWNPNYTWSRTHTISLFHKDLNGAKHDSYWGASNDRR